MGAIELLSFAASIPLIILGILLLFIRPYRSPQVFFALFAILLGAQIAVMRIGPVLMDPQMHYLGLLVGHALLPVGNLFLVHFSMILRRRPYGRFVTLGAVLLAIAAELVLILRPDLVIQGVDWSDPDNRITLAGDMRAVLFIAPQRLAFLVAILFIYMEYRRAKAGSPRRRLRGILIALALFISYSNTQYLLYTITLSPGSLVQFATGGTQTSGISAVVTPFLFTFLLIALGGIVAHIVLRPPPPEGIDTPVVFAFVFPSFVAGLEVAMDLLGIAQIETRGFWQILAVGVLVYTLASYQLFGLQLKVKQFAGPVAAGILVLFLTPILLSFAVGQSGFRALLFAVFPQFIGVAGIIVFQNRVRQALFPGVDNTPDYVHQRKMDIYRVALEETLQRGGTPEETHLKELRLRHGISEQEHSIIAWMVSSEHGMKSHAGAGTGRPFDIGSTVLERYRLLRRIGSGTYGMTFLAMDHRTKREVALKTVDMEAFDGAAARLLLREARLAASLDHPFVIEILDVAELPDRVVVVMEYADNGNLQDHLEEYGKFELPEAVRFLRELLLALGAVHERGIVHRNMKPKNILLEADGSVRLSDFGAAVARDQAASDRTEMATKTLQDILYQSPEQVQGRQATPKSDLFVAAILFHEVLTKRHPFPIAGKDDHRIRHAITSGRMELIVGDQPDWVETLLRRALAVEPQERFPDAAAMLRELETHAGLEDRSDRAPGAAAQDGAPAL